VYSIFTLLLFPDILKAAKRVVEIFNKILYDTTDFDPMIDVLCNVTLTLVAHVLVETVETSDISLKCDTF
jgi:hypothetical protein